MPEPYFKSDGVELYLGDMREVLPALGVAADLVVADPPYGGETSLLWDVWPDGWLETVAKVAPVMWCFGSMRMFGERWHEFGAAGWKFSQDVLGKDHDGHPVFGDVHVVWEKHNGSSFHNDRFRRVHEHALYFYQGAWGDQHVDVPVTMDATKQTLRRKTRPPHMGVTGNSVYLSEDGGPRLMRSLIYMRSMHGKALHPTEKPIGLLDPMIRYACPPGALVVDPTAGSGSTLLAARLSGRRAIGIEGDEKYIERAAKRLESGVGLFGEFSEVSDASTPTPLTAPTPRGADRGNA